MFNGIEMYFYFQQVEGFKQFFVVVSLPALAVREDKIEVKLVVFNYFMAQKNVSAINDMYIAMNEN